HPTLPLALPPEHHQKVMAPSAVLQKYTPCYHLAPNFFITVSREGDQLYAQATDQPRFPLFAESPREFFLKVVDAQITFVVDENGRATSLVLHQNGANAPGKRVE